MVDHTSPFAVAPAALEMSEPMRALAESGVEQVRRQYARLKSAAEDANSLTEASFDAASKGFNDYSLKLLDFCQANAFAAFDFAQSLAQARSLAQATDIWGSYANRQAAALKEQSQQLAALWQETAAEAAAPFRSGIGRLFAPQG